MYFKLVTNDNSFGGANNLSENHRYLAMAGLYGVITGSITNTSGLNSTVFNRSASVITGDRPTAGIYETRQSNTNAGASYNDQYFVFRKYHYGKTINSSYTPYREFYYRWCNDWGHVPRMYTHYASNGMPSTNTNADWNGYNSTTAGIYQINDAIANEWYSWEGIVNDKVFVLRNSRANNTNDWHWFCSMIDQEYQPNLDDHLFNSYADYCPTVGVWSAEKKLEQNHTSGQVDASNDRKQFLVFKNQVVGENTDGYNTTVHLNGGYHTGYYSTNTQQSAYPSYWPQAWHEMPQRIPMSNGDNAYMIQPIMYEGDYGTTIRNNTHYDYKGKARMMNFYRTNDDSFYTGERVTDADGNVYRAFRIHKCGGDADHWGYNIAVAKSAVYLFPEGGT